MTAAWRVTAVEPLDDARLRVTFLGGTSADVHRRQFLDSGTVVPDLQVAPAWPHRGSTQSR